MKIQNQDIVKSNAFIEACYNPKSVYQMRVLMACLLQIKSKDEHFDHKREFTITANALADMTGAKALANYRELKKAADELIKMVIVVDKPPNGQSGEPIKRKINVTSACEYYPNEGKIILQFGAHIIPYISGLEKYFTPMLAKYIMPMRSSYGVRLYELCLQWIGEEREFEVDEFRRMFGLENKYKSPYELKRKVINPAIKDINTHSNIRVKFGQRKAGRKVSHFQFMIVKPEPRVKKLGIKEWVTANNKAIRGEEWYQTIPRVQKEYNEYKNQTELAL